MSRSRKKKPIISNACLTIKALKFFKNRANKIMRNEEEIPNGNYYRKLDNRWNWPGDGRQYWDDPKAYRK